MRIWRVALVFLAVAGILACSPAESTLTKLHLTVPKNVSKVASDRLAGDPTVSGPILVVEGKLVGSETFTIRILASQEAGRPEPGSLLGSASMVGQRNRGDVPPEPMEFSIPLNEKALQLLANRDEVTLLLEMQNRGAGRPPFQFGRAYLVGDESPSKPAKK